MPSSDVSSHVDPLPSKSQRQSSCSEAEEHDFQHTIIHVTPVDVRDTTNSLTTFTKVDAGRGVPKRPAKITRASVVRQECISLPSLLPYRNPLSPSLRRSPSVSTQRCSGCSAQSHVVPLSVKVDVLNRNSLLELPPPKANESISISSSLVSFTFLSQSSSTSSLDEIDRQNFTVATRPPSRHGIAYELVFKTPSVRYSLTPEPQLGPDYTYSFPRATTEEDDDDNLESDDEFEDCSDSDESEGEEETDTAPPAPKCKYGVFFTAAKPPLPPSALKRIRRYRNYHLC